MFGYGMAKTQFQKLKSKLKAATFVTLNLDCCQPVRPKGSLEAILRFLLLIYSKKNNNARTLFVVVIAVLVLVLALSRRRQCLLFCISCLLSLAFKLRFTLISKSV